jgi:hypothetical protein
MRPSCTLGLALLATLACATPPPDVAGRGGPPDWSAVADEGTVVILTRNPDASWRDTTVWMVVVDGRAYLRTRNTRWLRNIERDPNVVLRVAGEDHPLRALGVEDPARVEQVEQALREKYGWQDRLRGWFFRGDSNVLQLAPRPVDSRARRPGGELQWARPNGQKEEP